MKKLYPLILLCACQKEVPHPVSCYACTTVVVTYKLNGIVSRGESVNILCNPDSARMWEKTMQGVDTNLMGWVTITETHCKQNN